MTRVDFYTNADSRLHTACVLAAKAVARQMRVAVFAPDPDVARSIDRALWTFQATSFVPHCRPDDKLASRTPVVIVARVEDASHDELMLNLATECPPMFSRFRRLIEIVSTDETERQQGRERWKFYKDRGYEINHVVLGAA
jgi:DNA polymerase-3 subunit chi